MTFPERRLLARRRSGTRAVRFHGENRHKPDWRLDKPTDLAALLKRIGWTATDTRDPRLLALAPKEHFDEVMDELFRLSAKGRAMPEAAGGADGDAQIWRDLTPRLATLALATGARMTKRWNTQRIMVWGAVFGVAYNFIREIYFEYGWPQGANGYIALAATLFGGALGGAFLFGLVSGARNLILKAK